jgi:hypothetical protein
LSKTELLLLLAVAACKDRLPWNERQLTSFTEGPFTFEIGAGWRDLSESQNPSLAHMTHRLGSDTTAHIIVRENDTNTDSNIAFMWNDASPAVTCETLVLSIDQQSDGGVDRSTLQTETMRGDPSCTFHYADGDLFGTSWIRIHDSHVMTVQCLRPKSGDDNADQWCAHYAAVLRAQ